MIKCKHETKKCNVSIGPIAVVIICKCGKFHIGERYGIVKNEKLIRFPTWADIAYLSAVLELKENE